ncbi:MAG TPA: hypothetical protein VFJ95_14175, partial [Gammaproteobacteria bacterium]|nr:hypothetical protein [Gammaproteobacteria bacterium]
MAAASTAADGSVGAASSMPITAVKTISETTRGFVRCQNWVRRPGGSGRVASSISSSRANA